jgi:hypothetical protein
MWDKLGKKRKCTPERLAMLQTATQTVVRNNPSLKNEKGRLCSAVFAELKRGGFDRNPHIYKKPRTIHQYLKDGVWNEKEFFYKNNYHWTRKYIVKYASETTIIPIWLWIVLGALGILLLRKLLK